ncbi:MAG: hypothetical protein JJT89_01060 [Nitriliruptoraceae bacterium]|nr:hypothetical protein [Nitriliruptoraceae bacterium]
MLATGGTAASSAVRCAHVVPSASLPVRGPGSYVHLVWQLASRSAGEDVVICRSDGTPPELEVGDPRVTRVELPAASVGRRAASRIDAVTGERTAWSAAGRFHQRLGQAVSKVEPRTVIVWGNPSALPAIRRHAPSARLGFAQRHFYTPGNVHALQAADVVVFLSPGALA